MHQLLAAAADFVGPIIPAGDLQTCAAGWGGLILVLNNLIKFALSLGIIIAVLMIAYAGFLWITNPLNPENRSAARTVLINSAIGLVLALSSWLIVNTILIALTGGDVANGSGGNGISHFTGFLSGGDTCIKPTTTAQQPSGQQPSGGLTTEQPPAGQPTGNEAAVRSQLSAAGITINKAACPDGVKYQDVSGGCTSVGGFRPATVSQIINVKNICGPVEITGGSELGHADGGASHSSGAKVDLSTNIDSCITGGSNGYFSRSGSRGSDARYTDTCGNEYVRETSPAHWDITVSKSCPKP